MYLGEDIFILVCLLGVHKCETSDLPTGAAGFTVGKVRQFPPIWMASTARRMRVKVELKTSKINLIPFRRCVQSCTKRGALCRSLAIFASIQN